MTHYEVLELEDTATAADIRRAYRRLVLLTHPDRTPDPAAHARYLLINQAYETLSHPARRFAYDAALRQPPAPAASARAADVPGTPMSPGRARDAARRRAGYAAGPRRHRAPVADTVRYAAEYARVHRYLRPLLLALLVLSGSLGLDYFLTAERPEVVLECLADPGGDLAPYRSRMLREPLEPGGSPTLEYLNTRTPLPPGIRVLVTRTWLWSTPLAARTTPRAVARPLASVYYGAMRWVLALLVAASLFGLRTRVPADQRLMAALLAAVLGIVVLYKLLR